MRRVRGGTGLALVLAAAAPGGAAAQHGAPAPDPGAIEIIAMDARFERLVPRNTRIERIVSGLTWVEGPAWDRRGKRLLFSDIPTNVVYAWSEHDGLRVFLRPSGYTGSAPFAGNEPGANGLAFDRAGRLLLCQHGDRRIARLGDDGKFIPVVDRYDGKRLNSPNDVIVAANGDLYFTDPPLGLPRQFDDPGQELGFSGVYRLDRAGKLTLLTRELSAPNGVAVSPSGRTLYVSNADPRNPVWMMYALGKDGRLSKGRIFQDARAWVAESPGVPDGMDIDRDGNLFAAGPGAVYVFAPDGRLLGTVRFGIAVSNTAWGDDGSTLYVTASTGVYRMRLPTRGLGF